MWWCGFKVFDTIVDRWVIFDGVKDLKEDVRLTDAAEESGRIMVWTRMRKTGNHTASQPLMIKL